MAIERLTFHELKIGDAFLDGLNTNFTVLHKFRFRKNSDISAVCESSGNPEHKRGAIVYFSLDYPVIAVSESPIAPAAPIPTPSAVPPAVFAFKQACEQLTACIEVIETMVNSADADAVMLRFTWMAAHVEMMRSIFPAAVREADAAKIATRNVI